jgi:hypothetical protein
MEEGDVQCQTSQPSRSISKPSSGGYQTTLVPPELRLAQHGWKVRQEWIAERDGQTIRGPSLDYVAGEAYRREDRASEKRARQAERSRIEGYVKSLGEYVEMHDTGWETYKANHSVSTEKVGTSESKRSHSKALKGLDSCFKALRGIHDTVARLKDDPALERYPEALALIERLREWGKAA